MSSKKILWDAHCCLPLLGTSDLRKLKMHHNAGFTFVSINIGMDMIPLDQILRVVESFNKQIELSDFIVKAQTLNDVLVAHEDGKLAVAYDLEGALPLKGSEYMVDLFFSLGVRQMHFAYNRNNMYGSGCYDEDLGLTKKGEWLVRKLNNTGITVDCSHTGYRTSMDILNTSSKPVVFSHSNSFSLVSDDRNIRDDQIQACANTGGVVCINGLSWFLNNDNMDPNSLVDHIAYISDLVGTEHVGIGLDYAYDTDVDDLPPNTEIEFWWPNIAPNSTSLMFNAYSPSKISELENTLESRGFLNTDISNILGENMLRVCREVWNEKNY